MNTRMRKASFTVLLVLSLFMVTYFSPFNNRFPIAPSSNSPKYGLSYNVYATITVTENGKLLFYWAGLDPLTNLGLNLTCAKLSGSNSYNLTTYNLNTTFVVLANYTTITPSASSVVLQNEWIIVSGVIHAQVYNGYNVTGSFSGFTGTNSTNAFGLCYENGLGNNALFGYTIFNLITGIDNTFTFTIEIQIQETTT
jgi:hypothetical protein